MLASCKECGPDLKSNLADSSDSLPGQFFINVIHILGQLSGNVIGIGLVGDGSQDVQLQELDVGRLIDAAVEGGVDLHSSIAALPLLPRHCQELC